MSFKLKKTNISMICLKLAIFCYFSYYFICNSYLFNLSKFPVVATAMLYISIGLLVFSILMDKILNLKHFLLIFALIAIAFLVGSKIEDSFTFALIVMFIISGRNKEPEEVYKFAFSVNMFLLLTIIGCSFLGIIENKAIYTLSHPTRECIGFTAPNAGHLLFFNILLYISFVKERMKSIHLILFFIFALFIHHYTDANAPLIYSCIIVILAFFARQVGEKFWELKILSKISYIIIPLCLIIAFVLPILYKRGVSFAIMLNDLTSTRIELAASALETYGITLFGQLVSFNYSLSASFDLTQSYFYIDSSFIKYMLMYGVVFMVFILFLYHKMITYAVRKRDIFLLICAFGALTFFVWNPQMFYVAYNPFLIALLYYYGKGQEFQKTESKIGQGERYV